MINPAKLKIDDCKNEPRFSTNYLYITFDVINPAQKCNPFNIKVSFNSEIKEKPTTNDFIRAL